MVPDKAAEAQHHQFHAAVAAAAAAAAGEGLAIEAEGTPLKKAPSASSAVFQLVARAGAVAGPPSRQTSGQFAAEHGLPTPPGSAR